MPFNMFPFSNLHNLNADWLLKTVKEAAENAREAADDAQEAAALAESFDDRITTLENHRDQSVLYVAQELNSSQQARARQNINAASQSDMTTAQTNIQNKVDIRDGHMVNPRIYTSVPGSTSGVQIQAVGGPVNNLALVPVNNGTPDQTQFSTIMVGEPTDGHHAAPAAYVTNYALPKSNPAATGALSVTAAVPQISLAGEASGDPTGTVTVALDTDNRALVITGAWPSVPHSSVPILRGVQTPIQSNDAVPKSYVDDRVQNNISVTGANPDITPVANGVYNMGVIEDLTVESLPASGSVFEMIFQSDALGAELLLPLNLLMPDGLTIDAGLIYDISVRVVTIGANTYGLAAVQSWTPD